MSHRVRVNPIACEAHGMCAELLPERITLDEWGYPVIDGDRNDLRFLDPAPCIVALRAKGAGARRDTTGFVLPEEPGLANGKAAVAARRPSAAA